MKNPNKRKLCLVIPSLQAGGMERVMAELAGYFSRRKELEVDLILYGISREIFYPVPENIRTHIPEFRFNNRLRLFHTFKTLGYLRKKIKELNPDSILSFGELWNSFVLLALSGLSYPVFISDRCSPERPYNRLHTFLRKWLYPKAEGIIAQTEKAREIYFNQLLNDKMEVIGNPIRKILQKGDVSRENIVLMVGRLIKTKHHDKLIELFLETKVPGWKLVIVGYDHLGQNNSERLKEIIRENNAEDKVFLEGKQENVDKYYQKSKIFAFTSSSEGFPNVIGEAMSAGIPSVAFDCVAGPSEMITDGSNGFLVPLFNYEEFSQKLKLLMENETLRSDLGRQASQDIAKFSIDNIGDKFYRFLFS